MMVLNKKGNTVVAVLIATIIVAFSIVFISVSSPEYDKVDDQRRVVKEAESSAEKGVTQGISDWMLNGFSDKLDVWYCNYPVPPELNSEVKPALKNLVDQRVDAYLENLRGNDEEYTISDPVITFDSDAINDIANLNYDSMTVGVDEFYAGIETENSKKEQDLSEDNEFGYKAWLVYKNMYVWMQDNAGDLTQNIQNIALRATGCQGIAASCDCTEAESYITEAVLDNMKLKKEHVYPAVDLSIQKLNDQFAGSGITCDYKIEKLHIENIEKREWTMSDTAPIDGYLPKDYNEDLYEYELIDWTAEEDPETLPYAEKDELGGCPGIESGSITYSEDTVVRPGLTVTNGVAEANSGTAVLEMFESCAGTVTYWGSEGVPEGELAQAMKIGMIAMDKKVGFLMTVRCEDPSVMVDTLQGYQPLAAEIKMRVSVWQDCPIPNDEEDILVEDGVQCPGGAPGCCFTEGTEITMANDDKVNIEDLSVGDIVKSYNEETGEIEDAKILSLESPIREGYYIITFTDGTVVNATNDHPFYTKDGWASIRPEATLVEYKMNVELLEVGDEVLNENQEYIEITSMEYVDEDTQTYTIKSLDKNHNFFAEGMLVHNKFGGILGIECPLSCGSCEGCNYLGGDPTLLGSWECVIIPNLQCTGDQSCMLCGASGNCDVINPNPVPCTKNGGSGDCDVCVNGVCTTNPPDAIELPCSDNPCSTCSGDGSVDACTAPVIANQICNDPSDPNKDCKICSTSQQGECIADSEKEGNKCGTTLCTSCNAAGECNQPLIIGSNDDLFKSCQLAHDTCWSCSDTASGTCEIDETMDSQCGTCKMCDPATGGCTADPSQNGNSCGSCKTCQDGACVADLSLAGTSCGGTAVCPKTCTETGTCEYSNEGGECGTTSCGLVKVCSDSTCDTEDKTVKCCGDKVCASGSPCCNIGGWTCEACPPTT